MTFPTFSFLPTLTCISPSTNSSPLQTGTGTFPHSSPMPYSLRQNSIPFLDTLLCFTFLILIHLTPPPVLRSTGFHFTSCMFSFLVSTAAPQHRLFIPFPLSPISLTHIGQPISLVTISSLGDSIFPILHGPCTALV